MNMLEALAEIVKDPSKRAAPLSIRTSWIRYNAAMRHFYWATGVCDLSKPKDHARIIFDDWEVIDPAEVEEGE